MKRGMYLQRTVILGFTESGMHLAEYLVRNHDIRSGIIGFIDDRSGAGPGELQLAAAAGQHQATWRS